MNDTLKTDLAIYIICKGHSAPLAEQNSTAASSGSAYIGYDTSFMRAKLSNYITHLYHGV